MHRLQALGVVINHLLRELLHRGRLRFLQRDLDGGDFGDVGLGQIGQDLLVALGQRPGAGS
nr:hypothetical protein [Duganella lactea]